MNENIQLPSKPVSNGASVGSSQKDRRYTDTFHDIHKSARFPLGRPWTGEREIAANPDLMHPDGFVTADLMQGEYVVDDGGTNDRRATFASVWHAPWTPLPKYFKFNYKRKTISFDYGRMLMEEEQAHKKYFAAAAKMATQMNCRVEYGVTPPFQITAELGEPTQMHKIAQAAIAGDPWLLGHVDNPNDELAEILGYRVQYVGSYSPDRNHVLIPQQPAPQPVVTPDQVLATPPTELLAMIADMAAKAATAAVEASFARRDAEKAEQSRKIREGQAQAKTTKAGAHAA